LGVGKLIRELKDIFKEVTQAILPISIVVTILQVSIIWMPMSTFLQFIAGVVMVMAGLFLFLLGVRIGLLPMGRAIGSELPNYGSIGIIMIMAFVLGFAVTVAEPDVRILAHQVDFVSNGLIGKNPLIMVVALGVGIFVSLAILRIIIGVPIAYLLAASYAVVLALSFFTSPDYLPVAFDAGGVTTGPLTVPFILAFGIGTASVIRGKSSMSDGFGLVGLASIGPIIGVMLLGVIFG